MSKTVKQIIEELQKKPESIMVLYRWLEQMEYSWESSEELCGYLLENRKILELIPRNLSYAHENKKIDQGWEFLDYRRTNRNGYPQNPKEDKKYVKEGKHTRGEDYLAMDLFLLGRSIDGKDLKYINGLGYVLDYQTCIGWDAKLLKITDGCKYNKLEDKYPFYGIIDPDKENEKDPNKRLFNSGKCDLIAFDNGHLIIYELKEENNTEPLIRAVMEAYTYLQMINKDSATVSFREHYKDLIPEGDVSWEAKVLLCKGKTQYEEYKKKDDSNLRKLMEELKITPVWYTTGFSFENE